MLHVGHVATPTATKAMAVQSAATISPSLDHARHIQNSPHAKSSRSHTCTCLLCGVHWRQHLSLHSQHRCDLLLPTVPASTKSGWSCSGFTELWTAQQPCGIFSGAEKPKRRMHHCIEGVGGEQLGESALLIQEGLLQAALLHKLKQLHGTHKSAALQQDVKHFFRISEQGCQCTPSALPRFVGNCRACWLCLACMCGLLLLHGAMLEAFAQ